MKSQNFLNNVEFSIKAVMEALNRLPPKTSRTPDNIPAIILRRLSSVIAYPLSFIFNQSFLEGNIPRSWKSAIVCPIFKNKGLASSPNNYRPVSLTVCCCKVMERIISNKMLTHLFDHKLLSLEQHGFLPRRSTVTHMISTIFEMCRAVSSHERLDCIYVDFAKGFDTVSIPKLLHKLAGYGFGGCLLEWIACFLNGRSQRVYLNGTLSRETDVTSGVPQGSVLGPILFLIYVNDVFDCLVGRTSARLFADDLKLFLARKDSVSTDLIDSLRNFEEWTKIWQLRVSTEKSHSFSIGHRFAPSVPYYLNDTVLLNTFNVKDVGITLSSNLRFSEHCAKISAKAYSRAYCILNTFVGSDPAHLIKAYKSFVRPIVEYASPVFSPHLKCDILRIERVQRFFTRKVCRKAGITYRDYSHRLHILNLQSLEHRRIILDLHFLFKLYHNYFDLSLTDFFVHIHSFYQTRGHSYNSCQLEPIFTVNPNYLSGMFFFRVVKYWNSLGDDIVKAPSFEAFKYRLKNVDLTKFCNCV